MAAKVRKRAKVEQTSLEKVHSLVRPNLAYDGEGWGTPRSIARIACFHGTDIASIIRLAQDGYFSGADPGLSGQFYTVPNPLFQQWSKTALPRHVGLRVLGMQFDPLEQAIGYAETHNASDLHAPLEDYEQHGVIIAFKGTAIEAEAEIYENPIQGSIELILPNAPDINTIEGVYPVDVIAAVSLQKCLQQV